MRTATLPAVRVTPEVRALAESVLKEGETLSMFIEDTIKRQATWRKEDAAFYARGMASLKHAKETGITHSKDEVMASLRAKLEAAKKQQAA